MGILAFVLIISFVFANSPCLAGVTPSAHQSVYGFMTVKHYAGEVPLVKISHRLEGKTARFFALDSVAEAEVIKDQPKFADFEKAFNRIGDAERLDDLKMVLSDANFQVLKAKVKSGVPQYFVLSSVQALHPRQCRIIDSEFGTDTAEFLVTGRSVSGVVEGVVKMSRVKGVWVIENETWYDNKSSAVANDKRTALSFPSILDDNYGVLKPVGSGSRLPLDRAGHRGSLSLTKMSEITRKQGVTFVFLMNNPKADRSQSNIETANSRTRVHFLGPKRFIPQQKVINNEYPVDVSLAQYDDGYAADACNLVLPNVKPHEVTVSLAWSF